MISLVRAPSKGESREDPPPGATLHAQPAAEVCGSVVDARGGKALSSVLVKLLGGAYSATTDSAGRFRVTGVAAGD